MLEGRSHAPEHACLWCEKDHILISGDQVLPNRTPIVGVPMWEPDSDPLHDFLETIDRLRELPADPLVLPSHILPFRGLHQRLEEARDACATPITTITAIKALFTRELNNEQTSFALREALAHVNYLMVRGQVIQEPDAGCIC